MKLYADEPGHELVRSLEALVVSGIARVEVPAALWRKERIGELGAESAETLVAAFEADLLGVADDPPAFAAVAVLPQILSAAAELTASHSLRAYDAVQLATAIAVRDIDPLCTAFACFDAELRSAAARSGFTPIPP